MRKYIGICGLVILAIFVAGSINPADCFAWRQKYQQELTDNPKLEEANKLYETSIRWIEDGDGVHEPERAAQFYSNAEEYLRRTIYALKELGTKHTIDVTKETDFCEKLQKETHSKQGIAKRESK
jgi:hypothetical protein